MNWQLTAAIMFGTVIGTIIGRIIAHMVMGI